MSVDISTWHREKWYKYVHKSFFIIKKLKNLGILISFCIQHFKCIQGNVNLICQWVFNEK